MEFSLSYQIRLLQTDEGWSVSCLDCPGCHSQGASRQEALANIREAIALWLEVETEEAGVKHVETLELAMICSDPVGPRHRTQPTSPIAASATARPHG